MPVVRFVAEGVGPFERLDLDLSDGKGNPHPGPHILVGVNGSGKSTALRAMAWALDYATHGFPHSQWIHLLRSDTRSAATAIFQSRAIVVFRKGQESDKSIAQRKSIAQNWVEEHVGMPTPLGVYESKSHEAIWHIFGGWQYLTLGAYAPSRLLEHMEHIDVSGSLGHPHEGALAFERTIRNEILQPWLLRMYSRRAIAREKGKPVSGYTESIERFESALALIFQENVNFEVDVDQFQPKLIVNGKRLNFSQIPDGVRTTFGWLSDFLMRLDLMPTGANSKAGLLLIDEIDAHLHPRWQRTILPAIRKALPPEVQIVVTTHSPFVVNSCRGARIHLLELDEQGNAHARPPIDAPVGSSLDATVKDIFDVDSRFDVETEQELREWNELKRKQEVGQLSSADEQRLEALTSTLSGRSEELSLIVNMPPRLSKSMIDALTKA